MNHYFVYVSPRLRLRASLYVFILTHFFLLVTNVAVPGDTDVAAVGAISDGYARNRDSFPVINCRFIWRTGLRAENVADALAGELDAHSSLSRHGHWLVHDDKVRYELLCEPHITASEEKKLTEFVRRDTKREAGESRPGEFSIDCANRLFLRGRGFSLRYGPLFRVANIFTPTDVDQEGIRLTPFNIDVHGADEYASPGTNLRDCVNGRLSFKFLGLKSLNGVQGLAIELGNESILKTIFFDSARGFLPVYYSQSNRGAPSSSFEYYITDASECSEGRWFPTRIVKFESLNSPHLQCEEVVVTSLDVDRPPDVSLFRLDIAGGTQVNVIGRHEWVTFKNSETVYSDELSDLYERCVSHGLEMRRRSDKAGVALAANRVKLDRPFDSRTGLVVVVNVVVLVSLILITVWKRRKGSVKQ
jgi:hypothetical protein